MEIQLIKFFSRCLYTGNISVSRKRKVFFRCHKKQKCYSNKTFYHLISIAHAHLLTFMYFFLYCHELTRRSTLSLQQFSHKHIEASAPLNLKYVFMRVDTIAFFSIFAFICDNSAFKTTFVSHTHTHFVAYYPFMHIAGNFAYPNLYPFFLQPKQIRRRAIYYNCPISI